MLREIDIIGNVQGRSQRFDERRAVVAHDLGHRQQVRRRQGEAFGKGPAKPRNA